MRRHPVSPVRHVPAAAVKGESAPLRCSAARRRGRGEAVSPWGTPWVFSKLALLIHDNIDTPPSVRLVGLGGDSGTKLCGTWPARAHRLLPSARVIIMSVTRPGNEASQCSPTNNIHTLHAQQHALHIQQYPPNCLPQSCYAHN